MKPVTESSVTFLAQPEWGEDNQPLLDCVRAEDYNKIRTKLNKAMKLLKQCLYVLDLDALASDDWQRPLKECPAWFKLRAELKDVLGEDAHEPETLDVAFRPTRGYEEVVSLEDYNKLKLEADYFNSCVIRLKAELNEAKRKLSGYESNIKCAACAEGIICGSTMNKHDSDCIYTERDQWKQVAKDFAERAAGNMQDFGDLFLTHNKLLNT
jgi:hypothetical protein